MDGIRITPARRRNHSGGFLTMMSGVLIVTPLGEGPRRARLAQLGKDAGG